MRHFTLLLALTGLLALPGCYSSNFAWHKVKDSGAPGHFTWRNSDELWGDGVSVARRKNGTWESLDVCGPYLKSHGFSGNRQSITVGFGSDSSVYALCGADLTDGQDLVHFNAAGDGVPMVLPNDGAVHLVQLVGDIALVGQTHLYQRKGNAFTELTAHPFASAPTAAGLSIDEIYATGSPANAAPSTQWWNGKVWAEVKVANTAAPGEPIDQPSAPVLRAGTVGLGPWRVEHGVTRLFVSDNPGLKRPVRFMSALPPDAALYYGTPPHDAENASQVVYLWLARSGASDLEYLGDGPFTSGAMYSAGGFGGYVVDESTVLMSSTHGAIGGFSKTELWEGGL
jgi:hypothetical protein